MSYSRGKFFWGAIDIVHSDETPYSAAQTHPMGADGLPPGIGVRRCQIVYHRDTYLPPQDAVTTHIDFLNLTNGDPDDTWTDQDFTGLEDVIKTMLTTLAPLTFSKVVARELRWYRVGPAILPPNPAIRVLPINIPGTGLNSLPPQVAATVTLKTVPRRQWGRMYLPLGSVTAPGQDGRFTTGSVDTTANAVNAMFTAALSVDFHPVIYSKVRGKAYAIETVQVDDVPDVMRSRRFNEKTYAKILP